MKGLKFIFPAMARTHSHPVSTPLTDYTNGTEESFSLFALTVSSPQDD